MNISMFKTVCVTNRHLVSGDFLEQIKKVLALQPEAIILREKDLLEEEYEKLGIKILGLCKDKNIPCYFNTFINSAIKLKADGVQLSYNDFCNLIPQDKLKVKRIGVSVHSIEEAIEAEQRGADFLLYGHIFTTSCKPGLPPRGLEKLRKLCNVVGIPVFAIGGIDSSNAELCLKAGAACVCRMSSLMK